MNVHPRARTICIALAMCCVVLNTPAFAVDGPTDVIATPAYERNMRTLSIMQRMDADGDHRVSREELATYFGKVFDSLDHDRDGSLDRKEWVGAARDTEVVALSTGGYARALASLSMMRICDADGDRRVTRSEFIAAHDAMYDYIAAGHDGPLDSRQWVARHFPN